MPSPLIRAERSVLGALLLDPAQLPAFSTWLSPEDFYLPAHAALYAAMLTLRANGHPGSRATVFSVPVEWLTDTLAEASRHTRGLTADHAFTLTNNCPRTANAPVYGRMVLEGAVHRAVTEHATRLLQTARREADEAEAAETEHYAEVLTGVLGDLARRWGTEPHPSITPGPAGRRLRATDRQAEQERMLLTALVQGPEAMDEVERWLRAEDFAVAGHGRLYQCIAALRHRGEPLDALTVLWEAQRRGVIAEGLLTVDEVYAIGDERGVGSAECLGEDVVRTAVARTAASAAEQIRVASTDPALGPGALISRALQVLIPLEEVRARWRAAGVPAGIPPPVSAGARTAAALSRSAHLSLPDSAPDAAANTPIPHAIHPRSRS